MRPARSARSDGQDRGRGGDRLSQIGKRPALPGKLERQPVRVGARGRLEPVGDLTSRKRGHPVPRSSVDYGNRGYFEKSGFRFSRKAFLPSLPSSVM